MGSRWYLDAPLVPEYHRRAIAVSCSSLLGLSLRVVVVVVAAAAVVVVVVVVVAVVVVGTAPVACIRPARRGVVTELCIRLAGIVM